MPRGETRQPRLVAHNPLDERSAAAAIVLARADPSNVSKKQPTTLLRDKRHGYTRVSCPSQQPHAGSTQPWMREVEKGAMEAPGVRYPVAAADPHSSVVGEASGTNGLAGVCSDIGPSQGGSLYGCPAHQDADASTQQQQQQQQQRTTATTIDAVVKKVSCV